MRIDKLLAHAGYGTRKEVKKLLKDKRVTVNGEVIKQDRFPVDPATDHITVDEETVNYQEKVYFMLNKPQGYVSATIDNVYPTVIDLIDDVHTDLFPIGRLDVDTEGLLIISNDGALGHQLTSPKSHCPKTYEVICDGDVTKEDIALFASGMSLDDMTCLPATLEVIDVQKHLCHVTIMEGKFHQVKRMFLKIGKPVLFLKRIKMGSLTLDPNLEVGSYRPLTAEEIHSLAPKTMV